MLSVELARELRGAGLAWQPAPGDGVHLEGAPTTAVIYEVAFVRGWAVLATDQGSYSVRSLHEVVWRPRLDQLLEALRERGEFVALDWSEGAWHCYGSATGNSMAEGATSEEACALALLEMLRAQPAAPAEPAPESPEAPRGRRFRVGDLLEQAACRIAVAVYRLGMARRLPLDWTAVVLITVFFLGFVAMLALLVVRLVAQLMGVPVVPPAGA